MSTLIALAGLVLATLGSVAIAGVSVAQENVFLKCEATDEWMKNQEWFVDIEHVEMGARINLKQQTIEGQTEWIYEIYRVNEEEIRGGELTEKDDKHMFNGDALLIIDRKTGRMRKVYKFTVEELKTLWNEEKQQIGGFDEDTWMGTNFDCVIGQKVF